MKKCLMHSSIKCENTKLGIPALFLSWDFPVLFSSSVSEKLIKKNPYTHFMQVAF